MNKGAPRGRSSTAAYIRRAGGFTIIETLVVLTVTGALFIAIAATLSGRQNEAQFVHAIQSVQSQIQQTINQVGAGFFPTVDLGCADGATNLTFSGGGTQGTNDQCVFLGKVMQFGVHGTDPEQYQTYIIAGLRSANTGVTSPFQNAKPTVVGIASTGNYSDYSTATSLQYGLKTLWVHVNGASIGAVGFLMEPGDFASNSGYNSGAQPVDLVPIPGTNVDQTMTQAVGLINGSTGLNDPNLNSDAPINPDSGVQICFVSGGTDQSGLITIGGSGRQLLVKLDIKGNQTCS